MVQNVYPLMQRTMLPLLVLSMVSNLAILISPLFMMQVLDRVIPSGNTATLALLGVLALAALGLQSLVEAARDLSLGRLSRWAEREGAAIALGPTARDQNTIIGCVTRFSSFLSGPAVIAALSAPWIPIFWLVLWMLHPTFCVLLFGLSGVFLATSLVTKSLGSRSWRHVERCQKLENDILQRAAQAEAESGIGQLARNIRQSFADVLAARHSFVDQVEVLSTVQSATGGLLRSLVQIGALALGAWLVTLEHLSAGGMIAASILTSKAYSSGEALASHMAQIRAALSDYRTLADLPHSTDEPRQTIDPPNGALRVENVIFPRGGGAAPRLDRIQFTLKPGRCLVVLGSSGAGKTTLLHALSGVAVAPIGSVFLGDHEIKSLGEASLFKMVGYLPQRPAFTTGTIAENIASFDPNITPDQVVEAAKSAGVHGLICALPDSYETDLGKTSYLLSAGQAQRVALARAIYTNPRYLFLDEPNALLDADGERALGQTLLRLKQSGVTIVMTVHRAGIVALADDVLQLANGQIADFGPKEEVLKRIGLGGKQIELPILETSGADLQDWLASQFTRAEDQPFSQRTRSIGHALFKIACAHCPPDSLYFSKFTFKFIDQTRCELTMTEPFSQQASVSEGDQGGSPSRGDEARDDQDRLVHLHAADAQLERVMQFGEEVEVTSSEEATHYRVVIGAVDASEPLVRKRRAQ